jgi:hypothetical protein
MRPAFMIAWSILLRCRCPGPGAIGAAGGGHPCGELLRTWNWKRPALDPVLLLGAIGQGYIGGALPWRSNVWITGGRGTGKSALNGRPDEGQGIIPQLYGEALFRTGNTSAAAIRQSLKNSTVPVMIDEAEAGADNRKITEVVELARVASSGDKMHRGGQDHQAHEFTLQSPFWFSSINIPPLEGSDRAASPSSSCGLSAGHDRRRISVPTISRIWGGICSGA